MVIEFVRTIRMENCRGLISTCCMLFLTLLAGAQNLPTSKTKENCTYVVTIDTTCTEGAETSNPVSLRFGDEKSNEILVKSLNSKHVRKVDPISPVVLDDVPRKPFQACNVDEFQVTGQCMKSQICYLYLKVTGHDDWRPGFAQVRSVERSHHSSENFYFRQNLPRRVWHGSDLCDKEVTPFGVDRKRKVFN